MKSYVFFPLCPLCQVLPVWNININYNGNDDTRHHIGITLGISSPHNKGESPHNSDLSQHPGFIHRQTLYFNVQVMKYEDNKGCWLVW